MQASTIYSYYAFGYNYAQMRQTSLLNFGKADALERIDEFLEELQKLDLPVTAKAAKGLKTFADNLRVNKSTEPIDDEQSDRVRRELERIDPALDAELSLRTAFVLTKKRFPTEELIKGGEGLLGKGVHARLADNTKRDFKLACKNIAFGNSTSAAFHLMRALEQQVKELYFAFKKTKRMEKPMWGPIIRELRAKRAPKPSEKLLAHLDSMRVHFRNPTQHPDAFYTSDEAQDLMSQTIVAINMINSEMPVGK